MRGPGGWTPTGFQRVGRWDVAARGAHRNGDLWILPDELRLTDRRRTRRDVVVARAEVAELVLRWRPIGVSGLRIRTVDGQLRRPWGLVRDPLVLGRQLEEAGWPVVREGIDPRDPLPPPVARETAERDLVRAWRGDRRGWIWMTEDAVRVDLRTRVSLAERVRTEWTVARTGTRTVTFPVDRRGRTTVRFTAGRDGSAVAIGAVRPAALRATLERLGWPVTDDG